ncbi:MAG: homoserine kinase [Pseudomonadota bacterium]
MTLSLVRARAPASVGNVGVGFDVLGLSLCAPFDEVVAVRSAERGVRIRAIEGVVSDLPLEASNNTAGRAAQSVLGDAPFGVELTIHKGIAIGSGMGGSAASAVAAAVAVNALRSSPLDANALLDAALDGESLASGERHADNVAPSLLGGLVLCAPGSPARRLPVPDGLVCVVVRPHLRLDTREGRAVLREDYRCAEWVRQAGHLAGFVDACHRGDTASVCRHLVDTLIEPQRKHRIPGFDQAAAAAHDAGAKAFSISGSGPAVFAWCETRHGEAVRASIESTFDSKGLACESVISSLDAPGAKTVETT